MVRLKLVGRNLDDVLNMDQMPVPFLYHSGKTLVMKGLKTIHARASTTDTKHVTLAATGALSHIQGQTQQTYRNSRVHDISE